MSKKIDISLISKCISKDRNSQKELYGLLLPYLEMVCKRYLKNENELKDVLQDSFVHIFRNISKFDIQKASFKTWSTKITINNCLKYNIKNNKNTTLELIVELHEPIIEPEVVNVMSNEELLAWLREMPFQYFEIFNMYVIDGFSHDEIAKMLNINSTLSRKRLSRARAWIKKRIANENDVLSMFSKN